MNASRLRHYFLQIEQTDIPKHTFKGTRDIHIHVHVGSFKNRRKGFFLSGIKLFCTICYVSLYIFTTDSPKSGGRGGQFVKNYV